MAGKDNIKIRVLAVENILRGRERIKTIEIVEELDRRFDIQCDRRTIYADMVAIDRFYPIEPSCRANGYTWSIMKGGTL